MPSLTQDIAMLPSPATDALEEFQRKMMVAREGRRGATELNKLCSTLTTLTTEDTGAYAFPQIQWDDNGDSDSDVTISSGMNMVWSSKRPRRSNSDESIGSSSMSRRLVRSKKIKSDLSTLGMNFNRSYLE